MAIEASDIETQAEAPAKVTTDEGTVEERSIGELIKADRYNRTAAISAAPFGLKCARIQYPGAP